MYGMCGGGGGGAGDKGSGGGKAGESCLVVCFFFSFLENKPFGGCFAGTSRSISS